MGYLGLDQTPIKEDNMLQRMFWPSDHAGETDSLGQQGFWLCLVVALVSFVGLLVQGHPLLAVLVLLFYGLGGIGVREHNQIAAILVALGYCTEQLIALFTLRFPGFLSLLAMILLIANIRGTWIADRWARKGTDDMPERMNETWRDWLVDQMPARVWPRARIPFYIVGTVYIVLIVFAAVMLSVRPPRPVPQTDNPSVTYDVPVKP